MPVIYTNTNPYQPNGYTPIQYGKGNGVVGNTFMTNFPYQDNGYAPIQYGQGIGSGFSQFDIDSGLNGPNNLFYNTNLYSTQAPVYPPVGEIGFL